MATRPLPSLLVALGPSVSAEPDADLLARYVSALDDDAFALLVRRYARLVWRVARTRCRSEATAEDVFQATFVLLARKANAIRSGAALPGWLHRTAHRLAVKASAKDRRSPPLPADIPVTADPLDALTARELLATVDDELAKLSDAERSVLMLCGIDHTSLEDAAARLGWSVGSAKGRLERARAKLRTRLDARGLTLPAVAGLLIGGPSAKAVQAALSPGRTVSPVIEHLISEAFGMNTTWAKASLAAGILGGLLFVGGWAGSPQPGNVATAAPVPKELTKDQTAWGDVKGGLQAGIRMPAGTAVEFGKSAEVQVLVRNVTKKAIEVRYDKQVDSLLCHLGGEEKDSRFELKDYAFSTAESWRPPPATTLEPGEVLVRWTVLIRNSPADKERPKGHTHSTIDLKPGMRQLVMPSVRGDLYLHYPYTEKHQDDFKGLNTGTLEVELLDRSQVAFRAPVPKEKGTAVLWSEPVRVDWKASRAERLAGVWMPDGKGVLVPSPTIAAKDEKLDFGGVDVRDADTGKVTKTLAFKNGKVDQMFQPQSLAVSPDGKTVYASGSVFAPGGKGEAARGLVTWVDVNKAALPQVTVFADPAESPITLAADGKLLGTFTGADTVEVQESDSFQVKWRSKLGGGKRGRLTALTFNAPDNTMAIGTDTGAWLAIDAKTGRTLHVIADLGMGVRATAASADGKSLAFGGEAVSGGQPLIVFAAKEVHKLADAVPEKVTIHGLAFSSDGKHLTAACSDGEVRVFDVEKGKLVASAKEHTEAVFSVAYSPDGKKLLTVGKDAVKAWTVEMLLKAK